MGGGAPVPTVPGMVAPTTIVVADDHATYRRDLRRLLEEGGRHEVIAEAADGDAALAAVRERCPDVLLLDLSMPGRDGLDVVAEIAARCPCTAVVVLTIHAEPSFARAALAAGVRGYVVKTASQEALAEAIVAVCAGATWIDPSIGVNAQV
jgi:DNA-binding NarL/FixJ family response regulator